MDAVNQLVKSQLRLRKEDLAELSVEDACDESNPETPVTCIFQGVATPLDEVSLLIKLLTMCIHLGTAQALQDMILTAGTADEFLSGDEQIEHKISKIENIFTLVLQIMTCAKRKNMLKRLRVFSLDQCQVCTSSMYIIMPSASI